MVKETLEKVLKTKVEPLVEDAMHKFLGVTIAEVGKDITDKIEKNPLITYSIDTELGFKAAKKMFKKEFLKRLLQSHLGNVSEVAKVADLDRRTIHRDIKDLKINISKVRKDLIRTKYYQKEAVDSILRDTLDDYKTVIRSEKMDKIYKNVDKLSSDIVEELPAIEMRWDEAEREFEKRYLAKALKENKGNISKTARKIGLRYETLHRKLKKLGIK
jgi:transcriptional regulator of acetoin/glycerol metabolism